MSTWDELRALDPELGACGERLLNPTGAAAAYLATVRRDGGPRVHPVMPIIASGRLHVFVVSMSPKREDLLRDGRYALHAPPPPAGGEEFYLSGRAGRVDNPERRKAVVGASGGRLGREDFETLFELDIRRVLYTHWANWGTKDIWPEYRRWRAPSALVRYRPPQPMR